MNRSNGSWWGSILVVLGVLLLLQNLDFVNIGETIRDYWPAVLVLGGIWIIVQGGVARKAIPVPVGPLDGDSSVFGDVYATNKSDFLSYSTVFGDSRITAESKTFRGGTLSSVFGDCMIDCSHADFAEGEQTIRVSGVFGDLSVSLPPGTVYAMGAHTLFGGIHAGSEHRDGIASTLSYNHPGYDAAHKRVRLELSAVFGDIVVQG